MPTTKFKNHLYRILMPLSAPRPSPLAFSSWTGEPLSDPDGLLCVIRKHHVFGAAVALSSPSKKSSVFVTSFHPLLQAAGPETYYRVASITKTATALVALHLCDRGILSLNKPIIDSLPTACRKIPELEGITLLHLLSHTSGITDPLDLESSLEAGRTLSEVLPGCRLASPGQCFRYSNLGFGLIGCMLEYACSTPLNKLFQEILFQPLGMDAALDASTIDERRIMPIIRIFPYHPNRSITITPLGRKPLSASDPMRHFGHTAGSLYATLNAIELMISCLRSGGTPLLRADTFRQMTSKHAEYGNLSPTLSYGLGLLRIQDHTLSDSCILGHQGFAYGCVDGAFWEEKSKKTVILLNGGCSEARSGRLACSNYAFLKWALRKEKP